MTYAFTANTNGSKKCPPIVIEKARRPCMFNNQMGGQLGFYYWNNAKAWMMSMLYQEWLQAWDQELQMQDQKILFVGKTGHTNREK